MASSSRSYFDHNATAPLRPEARRAVLTAMEQSWANPASSHEEGREARRLIEEARASVAALIGCATRDLIFTSGGTESIAMAIRGVLERAPASRRRIVVPTIEHSAVRETARLASQQGFMVVEIPCDRDGRVDVGRYRTQLGGEDVALAVLQWANPETGVLQPVADVGRICRLEGVPFLVDAVAAFGKLTMDPRDVFADMLAVSAHKIGGPQGAGALYVRHGIELSAIFGGTQEMRRRGGTPGTAAIAGFGAAARVAKDSLKEESGRLLRLRSRLESMLREAFPDASFHGQAAPRLPNTVNVSFPGATGEMLSIALDLAGFSVSTGSACASGAVEPSHVIQALGASEEEARSAIRLSLGWNSNMQDVDRFMEAMPAILGRVREGLPE